MRTSTPSPPGGGGSPRGAPSGYALALLAAVVLVFAAARRRRLEAPLEREEGDLTIIGRLLPDGRLPKRRRTTPDRRPPTRRPGNSSACSVLELLDKLVRCSMPEDVVRSLPAE